MSPLAAVALAREQGVATVVHVSCRDRNRLALQSQVVGAAVLESEGVLCVYGDPVDGVPRVKDLTATALIAEVKEWAAPRELAVGAVVNPFAPDPDRELRLLERKLAAGAEFLQSQMVFDLPALGAFLDRAADLLVGIHFYAGVAPCCAASGWPTTFDACQAACCLTLRIARSAWVAASSSQRSWRRSWRRCVVSTRCTSFRSERR